MVGVICFMDFDVFYNSKKLMADVSVFKSMFPFLEVGNIGFSVLGKPIPFIKIGNGANRVLYSAAFHANEFITTNVLMRFVFDLASAFSSDGFIFGYRARDVLSYASIYVVPLVNPDGVDLVTGFIPSNSAIYFDAKRIADKFPSIPFTNGWKANIRGVDLNLQFPARLV